MNLQVLKKNESLVCNMTHREVFGCSESLEENILFQKEYKISQKVQFRHNFRVVRYLFRFLSCISFECKKSDLFLQYTYSSYFYLRSFFKIKLKSSQTIFFLLCGRCRCHLIGFARATRQMLLALNSPPSSYFVI